MEVLGVVCKCYTCFNVIVIMGCKKNQCRGVSDDGTKCAMMIHHLCGIACEKRHSIKPLFDHHCEKCVRRLSTVKKKKKSTKSASKSKFSPRCTRSMKKKQVLSNAQPIAWSQEQKQFQEQFNADKKKAKTPMNTHTQARALELETNIHCS